jgi:hypothetical protein
MNSDFKELLQYLNENQVKYLIIGGFAVIKYTEPRYTKDIDIWVEASEKNAKLLFKALDKFGAPLDNLTADDLAHPGTLFIMGVPPNRVDIITRLKGLRFSSAWKKRVISKVRNLELCFISKEDLIKAKQLAGRPQDLIDLRNLTTEPDLEVKSVAKNRRVVFDRRKKTKK